VISRYALRCEVCDAIVAMLVQADDGAYSLEIVGRHHGERHTTRHDLGRLSDGLLDKLPRSLTG